MKTYICNIVDWLQVSEEAGAWAEDLDILRHAGLHGA